MRSRIAVLGFFVIFIAACSDDSATDADSATTASQVLSSSVDTETSLPTESSPADETTLPAEEARADDADPALEPGTTAVGSLPIGDVTVDYVTVAPAGFQIGDGAPVLLAFPPGGQDLGLTESIVSGTYLDEALDRGWVVVSPAAPDGRLFFDGSEALAPALMDWIEGWVEPEGGGFHIAGISNGGISSFRVAGENADRVRSLLVFPGFPRSEADQRALADLVNVPVRMFVGENDITWVGPMEEASASLDELGADVTLDIVTGEGHVIRSLSDGARIFDELDAVR